MGVWFSHGVGTPLRKPRANHKQSRRKQVAQSRLQLSCRLCSSTNPGHESDCVPFGLSSLSSNPSTISPVETSRTPLPLQLTPRRALRASWARSLSVSPIPLITGSSLHSASEAFPECQGADSICQLGEKEGHQSRANQSRRTTVEPWARVAGPHQGMHTAIPLRCFAETETPSSWEKLTVHCPQACRA